MKIKRQCSMLIDQNRYIGDDPVGHKCFHDAAYKLDGYLFCEYCVTLLKTDPMRLTIPPHKPLTDAEFTKRVKQELVWRL